jgi:hypothetical protein
MESHDGLYPVVMAGIYLLIEVAKYFTAGKKIDINTKRIEEILNKLEK